LCTFADATHTSRVVDAMLRSHAMGGVWQSVDVDEDNSEASMTSTMHEGKATA